MSEVLDRGCVDCKHFRSSIADSINKLRMDVSNLKDAIGMMKNNNDSGSRRSRSYCWLYVGIGDKEVVVGKAQLERCQVVQYVHLKGRYICSVL